MNQRLANLLASTGGVLRRDNCLATVEHHVLDRALESGKIVRVLPETYLSPAALSDRYTTIRAAVTYAGPDAAASHLTALELWGLPVPGTPKIHLMTDDSRHLLAAPGVVVHRRIGFATDPPRTVVRQGIHITNLETSIIDSWPLLDGDAKRAPAIIADAERMTTPQRLRSALVAAPRLGGRRYFVQLLEKLAAGCRSPLELWGHDNVFVGPHMPRFRRQMPIALDGRTVYLDMFQVDTRVNFELDGARYHGTPQQREHDLRRDAALAARGITVVRYTHARLVNEPDGVRREILAITRARS